MSEYNKLLEAIEFLKTKGIHNSDVGIILGTGLGKLVNEIEIKHIIPYSEIPHFPESTVEFHSGKLIIGRLGEKNVIAMQGRFHLYEGYSANQVVFPVRVMKLLGVQLLLVTNAAGGINLNYSKGQIVLLDDHINLLPDNPLIGSNIDELGHRFPDMSAPYSKRVGKIVVEEAEKLGYTIEKGVYASVTGPNLETRAEYRFLRTIGADLVGMSTVPEVIAAKHMGLECVAISIVTDLCDPDNLEEAKIEDILTNAAIGEQELLRIVPKVIERV